MKRKQKEIDMKESQAISEKPAPFKLGFDAKNTEK